MSKHKRRGEQAVQDQIPDVLPMPAVAEAAVCVETTDGPLSAVVEETTSEPPAEVDVIGLQVVDSIDEPAELPEPVEVTRSMRISCGKVIARKLSMAPAAAQQIAALLHDTQIVAILGLQLEADAAARINQILGT